MRANPTTERTLCLIEHTAASKALIESDCVVASLFSLLTCGVTARRTVEGKDEDVSEQQGEGVTSVRVRV